MNNLKFSYRGDNTVTDTERKVEEKDSSLATALIVVLIIMFTVILLFTNL